MLRLSTGKHYQFGVFNVAEMKAVGSVFTSSWVLWLPKSKRKIHCLFLSICRKSKIDYSKTTPVYYTELKH